MTTIASISEKFLDIIEIARFAPSAHNAQPWQVKLEGNEIIVLNANELVDGDPTGRETYIGIGIFTEAIIIAAESIGFKASKVSINKGGASITFESTAKQNETSKKLIPFLISRCTDRSIYSPANIHKKLLDEIKDSSHFPGVEVFVSTDPTLINKVAEFTSKAIALALSNPSFRKELSHYLVEPWSSKKRGIAVRSLRIPFWLALLQPRLVKRGLGVKAELEAELKRWQSASALIFITTTGDLLEDWFKAGRAYIRAALAVEQHGISQATSAAVIEASTYHEDVEELLGTTKRIQTLSRIGNGSRKKIYSPRLTVEDIVTSS